MIAIIDYGAGNIRSVTNALNYLNISHKLTKDADEIMSADGVVLPGVGNFGYACLSLDKLNLKSTLRKVHTEGIPFMGICLGLQLMFETSEESSGEGLGIFGGKIQKLKTDTLKIPNIGWSDIKINPQSKFLKGISDGSFYYFVHSYCAHTLNTELSAATSNYGETFDACVESGNTFACQFHPEKSSLAGRQILINFAKICGVEYSECYSLKKIM